MTRDDDGDEVFVLTADGPAGRVDRWLAERLPLSRSRIQALARQGRLLVDGVAVRAATHLRGGQQVRLVVPPPPPSELRGEDIPLPILYLDDDLVVVDKPAGMVVHPARGHSSGTLVHALLHLLRQAGGDPARPGIVHRLDKGTSGSMVVARTPDALQALAADFAVHALDRHYLALVWGRPAADRGTIDLPLARHPRHRKRFAVVDGGRRSVTHWALRGTAALAVPGSRTGGRVSLIECRLQTGRTHQVRVHLHHVGLPLLGDPVYRRRPRTPPVLQPLLAALDHPLLHAWHLGFRHPRTGVRLSFSPPPPPDFQTVVDRCGLHIPDEPGRDLVDRDMHLRPTDSPGSEDPV